MYLPVFDRRMGSALAASAVSRALTARLLTGSGDVGDTEPRQLRSEIPRFKTPVLPDCPLQTKIPLLSMLGAVISLDGEDTLSEAGVRTRKLGRNCWTLRKDKSRIDVV